MSPTGPGSLASLDGEIMPVAEAMIPATDDGLLRGDGAFEVIRVYEGQIFALEQVEVGGQLVLLEVAHDRADLGVRRGAGQRIWMDEALATAGALG